MGRVFQRERMPHPFNAYLQIAKPLEVCFREEGVRLIFAPIPSSAAQIDVGFNLETVRVSSLDEQKLRRIQRALLATLVRQNEFFQSGLDEAARMFVEEGRLLYPHLSHDAQIVRDITLHEIAHDRYSRRNMTRLARMFGVEQDNNALTQ